jgi:hypothetical protein
MRLFGWMLVIAVLAVPGLIATCVYKWLRSRRDLATWRNILGVAGSLLTLTSWALFVFGAFTGWIGGFGSHYVTRLDVSNWGLAISAAGLLCTSFLSKGSRAFGITSAAITFILWGGSQLVA